MLFSSLFIAVSAAASLVAAQSNNTYTVDPNSVPATQRQVWCRAQRQTCPQLCNNQIQNNDCDPNTLQILCVCRNGQTPNVTDYEQTVPSLMCEEWKIQCVRNSGSDATKQAACIAVQCGSRRAESVLSTSSASSSATGSSTASGSASATSGAAAAASSSAAAAALDFATTYGTGAIAAGLLGLFGLAL
ncbi:hypothetical protein H2201_005656 [Coniosporium apollinis]|uniref:DUF7707 domain-containing protein n=2 Tax=Coniosporium TaxID=2810619 RepID=A0ABQ9NPH3_9PEZI|nr:hypothetical protein H2199_003313 [Cladosporium sp. JES 115]KAJ9663448.1 hypothetical protein H2201_005656 [Coniosporium apollinis]